MKNKDYKTPEIKVVKLNMSHTLLAGSISESIDSATGMSSGSFGSRRGGGLWDDDDDE